MPLQSGTEANEEPADGQYHVYDMADLYSDRDEASEPGAGRVHVP